MEFVNGITKDNIETIIGRMKNIPYNELIDNSDTLMSRAKDICK